MRESLTTLDELWQAALPRLTSEEQRAALVLLREVARGEPVDAAQLAEALGVSVAEAEALLRESALNPFVYAPEDGRTAGFWGLSAVPTPHRFTIDGRTLWTWCAQDSLFLPELLGQTARIESEDPENGEPVRLTVSPDCVEAVAPESVVVSMIRPDTVDLTSATRVIATACHFIFFFTSRGSGERWVAKHAETALLSLDDAFALGKRQNVRLFGDALAQRRAATA